MRPRERALWSSAAPGGDQVLLEEAGAGAPAGNLVLCAKGWALRRSQSLGADAGVRWWRSLPSLPAFREAATSPRALGARRALPSGERQGDTLISLSMRISSCIHVANGILSFFWLSNIPLSICTTSS